MTEKKAKNFSSPEISKLQAFIVDYKTAIYIPSGVDKEKAKNRYLHQMNSIYGR